MATMKQNLSAAIHAASEMITEVDIKGITTVTIDHVPAIQIIFNPGKSRSARRLLEVAKTG